MDIATIKPYIEKKLIKEQTHPEHPHLSIFNYTNLCQIEGAWDEITLQCRGLIIDTTTGKVLARPFNKFFNLEERDHAIPAEETPYVFEKYDGSLGILYWVGDMPYIATRGSFDSDQARWATKWFREHVEYGDFNRENTYLFEIIYPENRIVVQYDWSGLVLIGIRDTQTGRHYLPKVYIPNVRHSDMHTVTTLFDLQQIERNNAEGFVIWYPSTDLFIKLKHGEYKRLHKLVTGVNAKVIWDLLRNGKELNELLENVPDEFYSWVHKTAADLMRQFNNILNEASTQHVRVMHMATRKDQALELKGYRYAGVVFAILDGKDYSDIIWRGLKPKADEPFKNEI